MRAHKSLSLYTSTGVCCVGKAAHIPAEETRRAAIAYGPGCLTRQRLQEENSHSGPSCSVAMEGGQSRNIPLVHIGNNAQLLLSKARNPKVMASMVTGSFPMSY